MATKTKSKSQAQASQAIVPTEGFGSAFLSVWPSRLDNSRPWIRVSFIAHPGAKLTGTDRNRIFAGVSVTQGWIDRMRTMLDRAQELVDEYHSGDNPLQA
jgi:hypothetical protein